MVEIRRILCPVDLSEFSRHALDHARAIAQWYDANITVLHVISPVELIAPVVGVAGAVYLPSRALDAREIANEVRQFSGLKDLSQESHLKVVVAEGTPAKEIVRHAEALPADLLVMGTHGRSGFERLFLGSVTDKVLRSTQVPVLTVPPPVDRVRSVVYKTILCPIEFSGPSTRALEFALMLAEETDAHLILLHVIDAFVEEARLSEISHFSVSEYYRHLEKDARRRWKAAVPEDARVWCTPEERVALGKPYREILHVADEASTDIIIMGVHGAGALNRRLFGSTTQHVIREAHCPVLTLRG